MKPAWMTNKEDPNRPLGLTEYREGRAEEGENGQQDDDTRATADDDGGDTRRDYTKAGYTEGDYNKDKTRRHLQSHGKAATIGAVPPIRGGTAVSTGSEATATSSMDEGRHRQSHRKQVVALLAADG